MIRRTYMSKRAAHDGRRGEGHGEGAADAAATGSTTNSERGAATAEYAIATMAAVAFAGLLVAILQSDEVRQILTDLVRQALTYSG
ncbi:DUF4244 domain-containing protein [Planctomonas deserti]|uniref:DUF4244 domain-containing protein n=1 Tax=Planctomonas deserti TaxID=2144185 RepID=UPI001F0B7927|nr:DUF4244 domain-containing protein [Planctomonas deserti]